MRRPKAGVWRNSRASRPPEGMRSLAWKAGRLTEWCMWARFWIGAEPRGGGVLWQEHAFEEPLKRQDEMVAQAETGQPWRSFAKLELVVPEEGANTRSIERIF